MKSQNARERAKFKQERQLNRLDISWHRQTAKRAKNANLSHWKRLIKKTGRLTAGVSDGNTATRAMHIDTTGATA
ncbi:hypothetical protein [Neisseria cinerea]|uniref:hypothetical protein n=1 Tax=Neisseria cinerea TaxID=483 RepID=UPI0028D80523|nr:hypothetical protein [Neisseria cinerea]